MSLAAGRSRTCRWAAVVVATLAAVACGGKDKSSTAPIGAETPWGVLVALRKACIAADEPRIRELVATTNTKAADEAVAFYVEESRKLRARGEVKEAFLQKFGQSAWEVAPPNGGVTMETWYATNLGGEWLESLAAAQASWVKTSGDRATVEIGETTWDLERRDGRWRLDPVPVGRFRPEGAEQRTVDAKHAADLAKSYRKTIAETEIFEEFAAKRDR